jgi:putative ABC transport system permease protein
MLERVKPLWRRLSFSNKMAMKNAFRNKKRTVFILFGVALSYGLMSFVLCMPAMMSDMMGEGLREFQPMDYNVTFGRPVSERALRDVRAAVGSVEDIEGKLEMPFRLSRGNHEISLSVIGLERGTVFYNFKNKNGSRLELPEYGILISDYAAKKLGVKVGDMALMHPYTGQDDGWVEVRGVVYQAMGVNAYMDKGAMAREYFEPGAVTGFYLNSDAGGVKEKLLDLPAVNSVASLAATQDTFKEYTQIMNISISFMLLMSGVLGFAIIYNATIISIGEREAEFSSLRVLGFSRGEIFRLVFKENNVAVAGGLAGGVLLSHVLLAASYDIFSTEQYTLLLRADLPVYVEGAAATMFFVILALAATYKKIQNLDFMAALKNRA